MTNTFNEEFLYLNLGLALTSFTLVNFIVPSNLMAGGTTGISIILYHLYKLPVSLGFLILNIPLIFIGGYVFGKEYGMKTIFSILAISLYAALSTNFLKFEIFEILFQNYQWLGTLLGGILSGIGIGIAICNGGNSGGTSILAQIIEKYFKIKIGTTLNVVDTIIVSLSGFILGGSSAVFTIISLLISGKIINMIKYRGVQLEKINI